MTRFAAPLAFNFLHVVRMHQGLPNGLVSLPTHDTFFLLLFTLLLCWQYSYLELEGSNSAARLVCPVQGQRIVLAAAPDPGQLLRCKEACNNAHRIILVQHLA